MKRKTYTIVRWYGSGRAHEVVAAGVSFHDAWNVVEGREGSSDTAVEPVNRERTVRLGRWWLGYVES